MSFSPLLSSLIQTNFLSYGLLGASGCGKTTLLSCIVGRRRLNAGEIWVLGGKPGSAGSGVPGPRIGYMPQVSTITNHFYMGNKKRKKLKIAHSKHYTFLVGSGIE